MSYWKIKKHNSDLFKDYTTLKEPINIENFNAMLNSGYTFKYEDEKWLHDFHIPYNNLHDHLKKIKEQ